MSRAGFQEARQRVHDYDQLVARWRRVARGAGLKLEAFARADEFPVYGLCTRGSLDGGFYLSAGIHGDEPAGPEALLSWAESRLAKHVKLKNTVPLCILPCLNPWGLVHNQRTSARGHDLNRMFDRRVAPVTELKRRIGAHRFALGLALHEDYDGQGMYLYEIGESGPFIGAELLQACHSSSLPIDPRRRIENMPFKNGLLSGPIDLDDVPPGPEALHLFPRRCPRFITFETPSEFSLAARVDAHLRVIEACVRHLSAASR